MLDIYPPGIVSLNKLFHKFLYESRDDDGGGGGYSCSFKVKMENKDVYKELNSQTTDIEEAR